MKVVYSAVGRGREEQASVRERSYLPGGSRGSSPDPRPGSMNRLDGRSVRGTQGARKIRHRRDGASRPSQHGSTRVQQRISRISSDVETSSSMDLVLIPSTRAPRPCPFVMAVEESSE